jgi:hypothetical protein
VSFVKPKCPRSKHSSVRFLPSLLRHSLYAYVAVPVLLPAVAFWACGRRAVVVAARSGGAATRGRA